MCAHMTREAMTFGLMTLRVTCQVTCCSVTALAAPAMCDSADSQAKGLTCSLLHERKRNMAICGVQQGRRLSPTLVSFAIGGMEWAAQHCDQNAASNGAINCV